MVSFSLLAIVWALAAGRVAGFRLSNDRLRRVANFPEQDRHVKQSKPTKCVDSPPHLTERECSCRQVRWSTTSSLRGGAAVLSAVTPGLPPLKTWLGLSLCCALSYAAYNLFIKKGSANIDPVLGGVVLQFVAALLGSLLLLGKRFFAKEAIQKTSRSGLYWAIAAGAAVGAAELLSFVISSMGVPAMQSIPIIIGGSVLFGTVLGTIWLKEALSVRGWFGVLLVAVGIALVGLDSGPGSLH